MNNSQPAYPPWQSQEKVELLTEIIRQSRIHPEALIQFISSSGITPNWGDMALPRGRSQNQCIAAYNELTSARTGLMRSTSVREFGPSAAVKRAFVPEAASYGGRMLQPRPQGMPLVSLGEPSEPPKKKRGRPTKAEAEERKHAALLRGDVYPTPRRGSTAAASAGPSSAAVAPIAARAPSVAAAQAAYAPGPRVTRTPPPPQAGPPSSESSSGRRRRGRPTRAEEQSRQAQESFAGSLPSRYPDILSRDEPPDTRHSRVKTSTETANVQPPRHR